MRNTAREHAILKLLASRPEVPVGELAAGVGVSEATMRRDLHELEERGLLLRTHGGATLNGVSRLEPFFASKEDLNAGAKQAIAAAALGLIEDDTVIYLDGGSTVLALARLLDRKRHLTIVTNSLMAAASLMDTEHRLVLVGGEFRQLSRTLIGPLSAPIINSLHVHTAFMGTIGIGLDEGLTTTDPNEAYTKSLIMTRAERVVLLADRSKFGVRAFSKCGNVEDLDLIVTEDMDLASRREYEKRGVTVLLAGAAAAAAPPR